MEEFEVEVDIYKQGYNLYTDVSNNRYMVFFIPFKFVEAIDKIKKEKE